MESLLRGRIAFSSLGATIDNIRAMIQENEGITLENVWLIFQDITTLEDGHALDDYNIQGYN